MYIAERIKSLRKKKKVSLRALAEQSNISKTTINEIENGIVTNPTIDTLQKIVEALGCSLMDLWEDDLDAEELKYSADYDFSKTDKSFMVADHSGIYESIYPGLKVIPVLGVIRAGEPIRAEQNIIGNEFIPSNMINSGEYFGLRVTGDSMNAARINDGDIVIVREQPTVENGEIAIVMVDGEDATIKLFYQTDTTITLIPQSTNPAHSPKVIDITKEQVKILGKVIKVIFNI